jgi:hypothetical protein
LLTKNPNGAGPDCAAAKAMNVAKLAAVRVNILNSLVKKLFHPVLPAIYLFRSSVGRAKKSSC